MDALILSCSTGGGHNAAGSAIKEELTRRGHHVEMFDPYALIGSGLEATVGNSYIRTAQKAPLLFGLIYLLGEIVRKIPLRSPVYHINRLMIRPMRRYLSAHHYDVIVMPHLFPAEIMTAMKYHGEQIPKTVFIATDYTCIPFTEETTCYYYIIPGEELEPVFARRQIRNASVVPLGIPVHPSFTDPLTREDAVRELGLDRKKHYILVAGGSIGAGKLSKAIEILYDYFRTDPETELVVLCGNNEKLYKKLNSAYRDKLILLKSTTRMAAWLKVCDLFISKPGGLSSTEAAVAGIPLIHISPIPGCEFMNLRYFKKHGMSIPVWDLRHQLIPAVRRLQEQESISGMQKNQKKIINGQSCAQICDLLEQL